jgi:signal transduction histidine kinase/ligand-binding sensor domain-containing protein/DNA-binding response OmpR family regulator
MKSRIIIIFYLLIYTLSGKAQSISFLHLTTNDGLPNNSISSIYQDEREFMWFGTRNGIGVYNGKKIKIYQKEKDISNSILYNDIYHITGDRNGHVFIMTNRGISVYDIEKDLFSTITRNNMKAQFFSGYLYAATSKQIFKYNGNKLEPFYKFPDNEGYIRKLYIHNDSILIGSDRGVYILTPQKELTHPITAGNISDIFRDSNGEYWITASSGHGLYRIQGEQIDRFQCKEEDPTTISSNFTHRCCEDTEGNIWIGTFNGLNKYDKNTGEFYRYFKQEHNKSLSHSSIWGLYCDKQGTIWIGTYSGGINYFNPQKQIYREYQASSKEEEGLSSPIIGRMLEDCEGNLWICTERGGINKYNPATRTYKRYLSKSSSCNLPHDNVRAVYYDSLQQVLWLGIHLKGLNRLDMKTGHFTQYKNKKGDSSSLPSNLVEDIIPYQKQLILATANGVTLFNPQTGKCKLLFQDKNALYNTISTIGLTLDHEGTLWIANNNSGACAYHFDSQKFSIYKHKNSNKHSLSSNSINSIYEDSQKRLWFCTNENGLDLYRKETDDFINFDKRKNGLASNVIYNICELSPEKLLVTTDKGFSILDYQHKEFRNYDELPLSCISENALYKSRKGEIFIGGTTGMISFQEKDLEQAPRSYRILPYRLTVNGENIQTGDQSGILHRNITYTPKITLKSIQNIFNIEYTTTDYIPFNKNKIVYRLEGFSDTWNVLEQNTITYTNLAPGNYTLIVKAENVNEKLVPPSRLQIEILPPFYRTIWAYLAYIISIIILTYYIIHTYHHRLKLQESLKYEKRHIEDIEKLNQAKLRFFTNISHEFRTPLTLIIGQMEMLLQVRSFNPNVYNKILGVYKSCLQLRELITELLDFRKQEQGHMTIKVCEHNMVHFIYEHYLLFLEYAAQRQITFNFEKSSNNISVWFDAKQMQKAINNLISNAFKYTKAGGTISIAVRKRNQEVLIEITDNGSGIAEKDIDKIFNRFYQADIDSPSHTGTGIGLALTKGIIELHHGNIDVSSELGEGTTFRIHLMTGKEHFTNDQICTNSNTSCSNEVTNLNLVYQQPLEQEKENIDNESIPKEGKYKILIVEDNDSLREMLVNIFKSLYTVITAVNGKEGLEKTCSEMPHIVISDIIMPEMSGTELCLAIKQNFDTCHIPVVLLTAKTTIEHNLEGLKMGADDYIAKPFNINILLSRCNNLVNNRIMLQEKFSKQPQINTLILTNNILDKKFMDKVTEIIENEIDNVNFSVDQLVAQMGIARTKLFTKLKAITGQTPSDLIMTIRLKRAAYLLKNNPELNISEISDRTGFSFPKYFSKCFKKKYHVTPQAYRKEEIQI